MSQVRYRANLSAKDFVFAAQNWGRSVILKQYDQNFSRQIVSPTDPDKDIGIPQIFYCHNVMPAAQGFQSVGYLNQIENTNIPGTAFPYQIIDVPSMSGVAGKLLFSLVDDTPGQTVYNMYSWAEGDAAWIYQTNVTLSSAQYNRLLITSAFVNGLLYVYIPLTGCWSWNGSAWTPVTLTGLNESIVVGIIESFGYMIAWTQTTVAWSSTLTPTDFTPSLETGAGGGGVEGAQGDLYILYPHIFGFIVFTDKNCVSAVYSGNVRYPFNFRKIIGGGGISQSSVNMGAIDPESGNLYAYTTAGLQLISVTQAQVVFPELANYIGGSRFEDFNDTTLAFTETDGTAGFIDHCVHVVSNRYLVISYGILTLNPLTYTHALIYDTAMKRWGKLKFTHMTAVENPANASGEFTTRSNFCLLDPTGTLWQVDFGFMATSGGTMILGKYQHSRDRMITLDQVDVDFVENTANLNVYDMVTYDGKTFQTPVLILPITANNAPQYPTRLTGMNHSLIFQGIFTLDSLMLTYHINGRR